MVCTQPRRTLLDKSQYLHKSERECVAMVEIFARKMLTFLRLPAPGPYELQTTYAEWSTRTWNNARLFSIKTLLWVRNKRAMALTTRELWWWTDDLWQQIIGLEFEIRSINYPDMHVHVASNGYFRGHCELQTTSMVTSDVKIVLKFPNYPDVMYMLLSKSYLGSLWGHCDLQTTSEVTSDLQIRLSDLNNWCSSASLASIDA